MNLETFPLMGMFCFLIEVGTLVISASNIYPGDLIGGFDLTNYRELVEQKYKQRCYGIAVKGYGGDLQRQTDCCVFDQDYLDDIWLLDLVRSIQQMVYMNPNVIFNIVPVLNIQLYIYYIFDSYINFL